MLTSNNIDNKREIPLDPPTELSSQSDSFTIGLKKNAGPFVTLAQAKAHLRLLSCFAKLRSDVRSGRESDADGNIRGGESAPDYNDIQQTHQANGIPEEEVTEAMKEREAIADRRWNNYLTRATRRFELYFDSVLNKENVGFAVPPKASEMDPRAPPTPAREGIHLPDFLLPPIDVAIVWHSYLLNPLRAWEDAIRIKGRELLIGAAFPLESLATSLNHNLRPSTPEAARFWETNVKSVPFHLDLQPPPFVISTADNPNASEGLSFACPRCEKAAVFVSYSSFNFPAQVPSSSLERGLADSGWERICSGCSLGINADVIRGTKMIDDLKSWAKDPTFKMRHSFVTGRGELFQRDPADSFLCPLFAHATRAETLEMMRTRSPNWNLDLKKTANKVNFSAEALLKEMKDYFLLRMRQGRMSKVFDELVSKRCRILFGSYLEGDVVSKASLDLVAAVQRQGSFVQEMSKLGWSDPLRLEEGLDDGSIARGLVRYHHWLDLMSSKRELLCPTLDIDLIWHTHQLLRRYTGDVVYNVGRYVDHDDKIEEGVLSDAFENTAKRWKARFNQNYSECGCLHNKPKTRHLLAQALSKNDGTSILSRIRAASKKPGDLDENSFDDSTHPSTHNGVAVRGSEWDTKRRNRKHRSDEQMKKGTRREGHVDPFIAGYGYMGLYPFVYVPPVAWVDGGVNGAVGSCVAASCGSAGCASAAGACATGSSSCGMSGCGASGGGCGGGGGGCGGGGGGGCGGGGGGC